MSVGKSLAEWVASVWAPGASVAWGRASTEDQAIRQACRSFRKHEADRQRERVVRALASPTGARRSDP